MVGTERMSLPFTVDEFLGVFADYNRAVWPAQILWLGLALMVVAALASARRSAARLALWALGLLWLWAGLAYHLAFFSAINPAARLFAGLSVAAAITFGWAAYRQWSPAPPVIGARRAVGWLLLAYALVGYPVIGLLAGQRYPAFPTFGLPCPITIFTFGILLLVPGLPRAVIVLPLLWSAIGSLAAFRLGVVEDYGLPVAALAALIFTLSERVPMTTHRSVTRMATLVTLALALLAPASATAHCDGMDGPVVKAAQKALASGDVNPVLIWVQKQDEQAIRQAFAQALEVRKLGGEAKELADTYFFETLVRMHRAGEGAPYSGLKPAGRDLGPAIPLADQALSSGNVDALVKLITDETRKGLVERFEKAAKAREFAATDVETGREYVEAYVTFIHYAERAYEAASQPLAGHFPEDAHVSEKHER